MKIKQLLCIHKDNDVVCWHWTHGLNGNDDLFLEVQFKCKKCGRYFFRYINDRNECFSFIELNKDKQWSNKCKPVFKKEV